MSLTTEDWLFVLLMVVLFFVFTGVGMWSNHDGFLGWMLRWNRGRKAARDRGDGPRPRD